jgi:hypothetical protein
MAYYGGYSCQCFSDVVFVENIDSGGVKATDDIMILAKGATSYNIIR